MAGDSTPAIDQLQRRVKVLGEIGRPPAVIGQRRDRREHVLVAALAAKTRLHPPDREQRPRRHAVALLNGSKHRSLRLLQRTPARDDGRPAALGEKRIERERKTALAAVGVDGRLRVVRRHQGRDGRGADALGPRLAGELLLPGVEAGGPAAALGGVGGWAHTREHCQSEEGGRCKCMLLVIRKSPPYRAGGGRNSTAPHPAARRRGPGRSPPASGWSLSPYQFVLRGLPAGRCSPRRRNRFCSS